MSTKQALIFSFMVVFLVVALVTLGMWFHYSTELDIKVKAIDRLKSRETELKNRRDALSPVVDDPQKGIKEMIRQGREKADGLELEVFNDGGLKKDYLEREGPLKTAWGESEQEWKKTYDDWKKLNEKISSAVESLDKLRVEAQKNVDKAQEDLKTELGNAETSSKDYIVKLKTWREGIDGIQMKQEDLHDKINGVTRDIERSVDNESDGTVIHANGSLKLVVVDLGATHGARSGMKFEVYSARHAKPAKKGEIVLTDVRATSSDAVIVPVTNRARYDSVTGWESEDPAMRFSPLSAGGAEETDAQPLVERRTKKDLVEEMRVERMRRQDPDFESTRIKSSPTPPMQVAHGFDPIMAGDWIANSEFIRVVSSQQHRSNVVKEVLGLRDVNVGTLNFHISEMITPFRKEHLKRLIERNRCKVTPAMTTDVDYVVSTADAASIAMLEERMKGIDPKKVDVTPDIANRRKTLDALLEGKKWGAQVLLDTELDNFFLKRQRKMELSKGNVKQPGQHTFFVLGETKRRSLRETSLYIQQHGGVFSSKLDTNVDYLVVGAGLAKAKYDLASNRLYYANEEAPATAKLLFDADGIIKTLGLKVLREEELEHFFGQKE